MESGKLLAMTDAAIVDFDGVCARLRAALEPVRAQAISLHDEAGDLLWLTESSMGPDEHDAVRDAMEIFARPRAPEWSIRDLGAGRSAVLLKALGASGGLVGAAMVIVDTRHVAQGARGTARLLTPALRSAIETFAGMRPEPQPGAHPTVGVPARALPAAAPGGPATDAGTRGGSAPAAGRTPAAARPQPAAAPADPAPRQAAHAVTPAVSPALDQLHSALRRVPIALYVQRLLPLAKGSAVKRYEVLLRSPGSANPDVAPEAMLKAAVAAGLGSMIDRRVLTELIGWMIRNPRAWRDDGIMFSVNLTRTALLDEHFLKFVGLCLQKAKIPKASIAFEIDVPTALKPSTHIAGIAAALHALGCPLILDDFAMRTECFDLLRLPAVKYIKLAPQVTADMRTDKLAQAQITALVQMARVLGMHTVAKHTESAAEQEWLTALGVDFIQSIAVAPPVPIGTLAETPAGKV
jgi:EAL domain-containing protein (putative c-di-GMP-specific phosphodiesterase class I)